MQQSILLTISYLIKYFEDVLNQLVNATKNQEKLLHLEVLSVVVQILETNGKQLTDYDEVYKVLDVLDVQFTDETLHFGI